MLHGYGGYTSRLALFLLQYFFPLVMIDVVILLFFKFLFAEDCLYINLH